MISALIAGVGMCLSMNVIGNGSSVSFVLGVIIGLVGLAGMGIQLSRLPRKCWQGVSRSMPLRSWNWQKRSAENKRCKGASGQVSASAQADRMHCPAGLFCGTHFHLCISQGRKRCGVPDFFAVSIFPGDPACRLASIGRAVGSVKAPFLGAQQTGPDNIIHGIWRAVFE